MNSFLAPNYLMSLLSSNFTSFYPNNIGMPLSSEYLLMMGKYPFFNKY